MKKENNDGKTWKYFKPGDIVRCPEIWGNKYFKIYGFDGNWYCPILLTYECGKPKTNNNICNINVRYAKLVTSSKRPLRNLKMKSLVKLMSKSIEAKREFIMRNNSKNIQHV